MYKKVVKFTFEQQKIFWVLVFSFMYLVLVDAMDRSFIIQVQINQNLEAGSSVKKHSDIEFS